MARALPRRAKVSVRDRLRLPDGLRAFAQGSYIVSLRWRSGCSCGHQFYMPPVGSENLYSRTSPDGKQANRPAGISLAPKARFYGSPAAGGHIYSSPRSGDTTTLGPKGPVKPENPPAKGRSNLRTFSQNPLAIEGKIIYHNNDILLLSKGSRNKGDFWKNESTWSFIWRGSGIFCVEYHYQWCQCADCGNLCHDPGMLGH